MRNTGKDLHTSRFEMAASSVGKGRLLRCSSIKPLAKVFSAGLSSISEEGSASLLAFQSRNQKEFTKKRFCHANNTPPMEKAVDKLHCKNGTVDKEYENK